MSEIKLTEELTEDKYNCGCYDSGYCYSLGRPLTDEEDNICEYNCYIIESNEEE